jgi:hypothetical protein
VRARRESSGARDREGAMAAGDADVVGDRRAIVRRYVVIRRRQPSGALEEGRVARIEVARPKHENQRVYKKAGRAIVSLERCGDIAMSRGLL